MKEETNNPTTNAFDQAEAKRIKEYLAEQSSKQQTEKSTTYSSSSSSKDSLDTCVSIDEGANKYVLISAFRKEEQQKFVVSQRGAHYHRNVAESFLPTLEEHGYTNIQIQGGGRISLNSNETKIHVFGHSYGFGQANHEEATEIIRNDTRYSHYHVTWSNDGY